MHPDDAARATNAVLRRLDPPPTSAPDGPLAGVRVGIKGNIYIRGVVTTCASRAMPDEPAAEHADVVDRLLTAGAALTCTLNLSEFAVGVTNGNSAAGPCRNPWDLDRVPGGSSGGSGAAVAAGLVDVALGTDTGGSVRLPAAANGVTGLRPTVGSVSNRGVFPVCGLVDTVGPLARTVELVATTSRVLAGSTAPLPDAAPPRRIGIPVQLLADVDPGVRAVVDAAIEVFGAVVVPVEVEGLAGAQEIVSTLVYADLAVTHARLLADAPQLLHPDTLTRFRLGLSIPSARRAAAVRARAELQTRLDPLFDDVDLLVCPTLPVDVPLVEGGADVVAQTRRLGSLTYPWSLHAGPTLALPVGRHPASGMPVGAQLVGPSGGEDRLFAAGLWFQQQTAWHTLRPPVCVG